VLNYLNHTSTEYVMADKTNINPFAPQLPPEAIAFATKMYDAARAGQMDIFQQALPAGLPASMTNDKGDSLVGLHITSLRHFPISPNPKNTSPTVTCVFLLLQTGESALLLWRRDIILILTGNARLISWTRTSR
jgi:hypothetical protein